MFRRTYSRNMLFLFVLISKIIYWTVVRAHDTSVISLDERKFYMSMIFPGTKWCGPGNISANYDDLGNFRDTDICCREHDHCDSISANETKYGLTNNFKYTRLHCMCDKNFFQCLHKSNTYPSNMIGSIYFEVTNQCYREDYPISGCIKQEGRIDPRCTHYSFDNTRKKIYQWFDLPHYEFKKFPDYHSGNF